MIRIAAYVLLAWGLIALVGGMAEVMDVTVMLPATSAVLVAHAAFAGATPLTLGLGLAVTFGYLEDLHQGAPVGTLCLAHALTYLVLRWLARRLDSQSWFVRSSVAALAVSTVDLIAFVVLLVLADAFGVERDALITALWDVRWHALATALIAPPVWSVTDRFFSALRIDDSPPERSQWVSR
jgi:cell shape-determining protein MreD